jgi:KDO2-lipid IV(A) lauroyltransferase
MSWLKQARWVLEYGAYRVVEWIVSLFPIAKVYGFGTFLGRVSMHLLPGRRAIVRRNLRVAFGQELSPREIDLLIRRVFEKTGGNLLSAIRTAQLDPGELAPCVRTVNRELLERESAGGRGVILLVPHMGNWELVAQLSFLLPEGTAGGAHYRPLNNPYMDRLTNRRRQRQGATLFAKRGSPHAMAAHLREGGVLGILADQRTGFRGHFCPFFGRFTSCSPLPEALAQRTGAPVLALSQRLVSPGCWEIAVHPIEGTDSAAVARGIEKVMRVSPSEVFWFADRFRLGTRNPLRVLAKPHGHSDPRTSAKPVRLLLWFAAPAPEECRLPQSARPDLLLEIAIPEGSPTPATPGFEPARIWEYDPSLPAEQLAARLQAIDDAKALPLDGVIARPGTPDVTLAARRARIPLLQLPATPD